VRGTRDRDRMVVGFTTTYAISAYHHWCCEFESRSGRGVQHYVIKFVSYFRQVGGFLRVVQILPPINWPPRYSWNIFESGVKHHQTNTKHIKSVIIICPINIYTYIERGIIFLLHRFIFNVNAVGIGLLKLLFNNRFNTIIFLFLKININDTMIIYVFLYQTMTVHYILQCISRIASTVSSMKNIWIVLVHLVIRRTDNTMAQRMVKLATFVKDQ
jgi:hypothetical protein